MRRRAALASAALAAGGLGLIAGPSSAATVRILSFIDPNCCSISDGSKLQADSDGTEKGEAIMQTTNANSILSLNDQESDPGDPISVNDVANDGSERAGDFLGPDAVAIKEIGGLGDNIPEGVSSVAAPEPSVLTKVLMIFADLRFTLIRGR